VSQKNCANLFFCQNFVKFQPIAEIFGIKIAERTSFSEVYSFSTSPNLCQRTLRHGVVSVAVARVRSQTRAV